ncbi:MAG: hypothetical protein H7Y22_08160 [Gemmatimonadaceae bacterium]|nr:hypothetical protein [Gloeobacterales cyanobacterium ES-bin-141]
MLRRFTSLPWQDIFLTLLVSDLVLLVACPVFLLLLFAIPFISQVVLLLSSALPLLVGGAGGLLVRALYERLAPNQVLTIGMRWVLAFGVGFSMPLLGAMVSASLQNLPLFLNLDTTGGSAQFLVASGALIEQSRVLWSGLIFVVGAVVGVFWGWRRTWW